MTSEVVGEIEAHVQELRAGGLVPEGLEDELDKCFDEVADQSLAAASAPPARNLGATRASLGRISSLKGLCRQAERLARRRFGPSLRRMESRAALSARRAAEGGWIQVHVTADHLERVAAHSAVVSRVLSTVRPRELVPPGLATRHPAIEGALLSWTLDHLSSPHNSEAASGSVLHAECGDGSIVELLVARGLDARGADPSYSERASGDARVVAGGALEYLGASPPASFDGVLLTGVVDRLRPGAARALAELAARSLVPGGTVVLVSARPEANMAKDPVAADLAPGRPLHPVTWCHLLAHAGLLDLEVFEPDASDPEAREPELFAVSARRPGPGREAREGGRR
jgi:hypothetical protein